MKKRVGLLGGTFDPVHNGHVEIAKSFLKSSLIDELWVLLTPFPPHKSGDYYIDYETRLRLVKAAFSNMPDVHISTIENDLPKPSYTYKTLRFLKESYPEFEFFFCLGEDSVEKFHTWKNHEEIIEEVELLGALRPGYSHDRVHPKILDRTSFIEHEPFKISSSEIKEKIQQGMSLGDCVPDEVAKIIIEERLYTN